MEETALTTEDLALLAGLEQHLAAVARGSESRFVLVLADADAATRAILELERRGTLVVKLGPGEDLLAALVARLLERRDGRPGVAALVDPLVSRAAEYVLGNDLPSLESYLTPEALDEQPAVAGRALAQKFPSALAAVLPGVPESVIETLLRERTGFLEGRPGLAEVLRRCEVGAEGLLGIAARAERAVLVWHGCVDQGGAGRAHEVATSVGRLGAVSGLAVSRASWELERVLLDEAERTRLETHALPAPSANTPVQAEPTAPPPAPLLQEAPAAPTAPTPAPAPTPLQLASAVATPVAKRVLAVEPAQATAAPPEPAAPSSAPPPVAPREPTPPPHAPKQRAAAGSPMPWSAVAGFGLVAGLTGGIFWWRSTHPDLPPPPPATGTVMPVPTESVAAVSTDRRPAWTIQGPNPYSETRAQLSNTVPRALMLQLSAAQSNADRLRIVDLAINTTKPDAVVGLVRQLFYSPQAKSDELDAFREGLTEKLVRLKGSPSAVTVLVEATDSKLPRPVRIAAVRALAAIGNDLPQEGSIRLAQIAQSDSDPEVQERARTLVQGPR